LLQEGEGVSFVHVARPNYDWTELPKSMFMAWLDSLNRDRRGRVLLQLAETNRLFVLSGFLLSYIYAAISVQPKKG
jgi:hypothetical protein